MGSLLSARLKTRNPVCKIVNIIELFDPAQICQVFNRLYTLGAAVTAFLAGCSRNLRHQTKSYSSFGAWFFFEWRAKTDFFSVLCNIKQMTGFRFFFQENSDQDFFLKR